MATSIDVDNYFRFKSSFWESPLYWSGPARIQQSSFAGILRTSEHFLPPTLFSEMGSMHNIYATTLTVSYGYFACASMLLIASGWGLRHWRRRQKRPGGFPVGRSKEAQK
jgi:hypothetical protein